MTTRECFLDAARSRLGNHPKNSPEVEAIWTRVLDPARTKDWCSGLTLACLRDACLG